MSDDTVVLADQGHLHVIAFPQIHLLAYPRELSTMYICTYSAVKYHVP